MKNIFLFLVLVFIAYGIKAQGTVAHHVCDDKHPLPEAKLTYDDFEGGDEKFQLFLKENLHISESWNIKEREIIGVEIVVDSLGVMQSYKALDRLPNCPECVEELIRVIKLMPPWKRYYNITYEGYISRSILIIVDLAEYQN
jgi:hypothetical protein